MLVLPRCARLRQMEVRPLPSHRFGCEITGLSLPAGPSPAEIVTIAAALATHGLVILRDQRGLTPAHEVAFARRLEALHAPGCPPAVLPERPPPPPSANVRGCQLSRAANDPYTQLPRPPLISAPVRVEHPPTLMAPCSHSHTFHAHKHTQTITARKAPARALFDPASLNSLIEVFANF